MSIVRFLLPGWVARRCAGCICAGLQKSVAAIIRGTIRKSKQRRRPRTTLRYPAVCDFIEFKSLSHPVRFRRLNYLCLESRDLLAAFSVSIEFPEVVATRSEPKITVQSNAFTFGGQSIEGIVGIQKEAVLASQRALVTVEEIVE